MTPHDFSRTNAESKRQQLIALRLSPADNIAVCINDVETGQVVTEGISAIEPIPTGHKVALKSIEVGEPVLKYGVVIGQATTTIREGGHVHRHNLGLIDMDDRRGAASFYPDGRQSTLRQQAEFDSFLGIPRPNGAFGTRNYFGVLPTVNCSATVSKAIAEKTTASIQMPPHIDGVVALTHTQGCGMATSGEGMTVLRRTLAGYLRHPNFAGLLVVGLGCEHNQVERLLEYANIEQGPNLRALIMQDEGGTRATIDRGVEALSNMINESPPVERTEAPLTALKIGLQCGASDGFSALTANPALGAAVDLLVANGGTAILSETSEIWGAEHLLYARSASPEISEKLMRKIEWWRRYTKDQDGQMNNNPPPGNQSGGITTIFEKSLGGIMKGGSTTLNEVYDYAETITASGLVFMDSPGYDPCSVTGQVASGANVICFTTGRGSAFGCRPVPSIKLSSTTSLFEKMNDDMDLDCGVMLTSDMSSSKMGREILRKVISVASGENTKSEMLGIGFNEFVPWHIGAVF